MSHLLMEYEEDQAYITDELGNTELAQSSVATTDSAESSSAPQAQVWGEWPDDPAYLEALQEVERATEEVPDELLLQAVTECE
ncbi:DNA-directed primase/polymerase protein-like [Sinocyclocheilus grahami]|uniref:DNA-directed primase/polymerase protein-like n=1 Tax=Sinocyclocheilus grahami TaxID=75366 RepID=UPI0007ACE3DA|nr:PREDICTED: DNA-directed primase/polymerase protein-like [Sinocyclocheilus grahami]